MNLELSDREKKLITGMIVVQMHHAEQCDQMLNRKMAEKQKSYDLERVAFLKRILSIAK